MKAWQIDAPNEPFVLRDVPDPIPAGNEIVIDVKAAGLCHSDVGFRDGTISSYVGHWPMILGHEIAGTVSAVGDGVTAFGVGDKVGVPATMQGPGVIFDGGFATKVAVRDDLVSKVPDAVSFELAAAATDAGISSYHAVVCCGLVGEGTKIGVIGLGGLGSLGAQIAVARGAELYVAEINPAKHDRARQIGAVQVATDITVFADTGLDVIVDFAGFGTTTAAAIETVRPHGRVVQVGLARQTGTLNLNRLTFESLTLIGSSADGDRADLEAVFDLIAADKLHPELEIIPFDAIGEGMSRLERGEVPGRLVATVG